tara:strand:+ start:627 stop:1682 length:1056 start_codon:yes stop_codon:yes gene_type:complete
MEEKKYRLLIIGPANRHIESFVARVINNTSSIELITNSKMNLPERVGVNYISFSFKKPFNFFLAPYYIRKKIKEFKPDVIHVHQINSVALYSVIANKKIKVPMVISAWGSDILINPVKSKILRWLVRKVLNNGTAFTSDSLFMANKMRELVPQKELIIEICNFGVQETELIIKKEKVIYSNRMHNPLYRIVAVIDSFAHFISSSENIEWKLVLAGRGSETNRLKQQVSELGIDKNVIFAGFLTPEQNNNYYAKAAIFISMPQSDATAMSLLEAMYYGCFPILSDLPANREWVENGKNGIIIDENNGDFISDSLEYNFSQIGKINRERIIEEATVTVSSEKFVGIHKKAMEL